MGKLLPAPSHFYWIGSKTVYEDGFVGVQDPDWYEQAYEHGMACECKALHPDYPPLPVDMDLAIEPPDSAPRRTRSRHPQRLLWMYPPSSRRRY